MNTEVLASDERQSSNRIDAVCELCGNSQKEYLFSKKDKFGIDAVPFDVHSCLTCELRFVSPRPGAKDIGRFYPETYQWREEETSSGPSAWVSNLEKAYRYHQLRSEIKKLAKYFRPFPKKVLDVGCGTGDRLYLMKQMGCDVMGVETSKQAVYARRKFGMNVFQGTLEDASLPRETFDLVVLYNVLEHVHHPAKVIAEIERILKPGGHVVIEVPNAQSWQGTFLGARWAAVDIPRDLFYFNRKVLAGLMARSGFIQRHFDTMTNFWHPPTLVISLFPDLDPQLIWSRDASKRSGGILKRVAWAGLTLIAAPFVMFENFCGRGALMTMIAQKEVRS